MVHVDPFFTKKSNCQTCQNCQTKLLIRSKVLKDEFLDSPFEHETNCDAQSRANRLKGNEVNNPNICIICQKQYLS